MCSSSDKTAEITTVQYYHWFRGFVRERVRLRFKLNTLYNDRMSSLAYLLLDLCPSILSIAPFGFKGSDKCGFTAELHFL
jgi:hypothetical protein